MASEKIIRDLWSLYKHRWQDRRCSFFVSTPNLDTPVSDPRSETVEFREVPHTEKFTHDDVGVIVARKLRVICQGIILEDNNAI